MVARVLLILMILFAGQVSAEQSGYWAKDGGIWLGKSGAETGKWVYSASGKSIDWMLGAGGSGGSMVSGASIDTFRALGGHWALNSGHNSWKWTGGAIDESADFISIFSEATFNGYIGTFACLVGETDCYMRVWGATKVVSGETGRTIHYAYIDSAKFMSRMAEDVGGYVGGAAENVAEFVTNDYVGFMDSVTKWVGGIF